MLLEYIVFMAFVYLPILSIRCPKCGSRWFWQEINKVPGGINLDQLQNCPKCGTSCQELAAIRKSTATIDEK